MRENPWAQRRASFELERRASWLAARFALTASLLLSLDGTAAPSSQSPFSAAQCYQRQRRSLLEADARELSLLGRELRIFRASDFLAALRYEDRAPDAWMSAFETSLLRFEALLLEELESKVPWPTLEPLLRAHAHRFGTTQVPGSLLNSPSELPSLLCHLESPLATPVGPSLFLWERLTSKDVRFTDLSNSSPFLRKIRTTWTESLCRAALPGSEIQIQDSGDRVRFRLIVQRQIAREQIGQVEL